MTGQRVIEDFSMDGAKIRVLVTSDIAAEGVNLHKQCHHLIHMDLPWSLITLEQRNGRIDRYGQRISPEIRFLTYLPEDETIASDFNELERPFEDLLSSLGAAAQEPLTEPYWRLQNDGAVGSGGLGGACGGSPPWSGSAQH